MAFGEGQPVKLVALVKVPGRGIILNAGGTEPFPDDLFTASQAFSFFSVNDDRARFRCIPRSHNFSLLKIDELVKSQKYFLPLDGGGPALWSKVQYSTG